MKVKRESGKGKRREKIKFFWNIGVIILLISSITIFLFLSLNKLKSAFPIRNIIFYGSKNLTDEELKSLTGIHENESLITVSEKEVCEKLLRSPWIRSVGVRKELPHTLAIVVEEVAPFALLEMNNRLFIINEKGDLLEELKDDPIPFLPVIRANPYNKDENFSEALNLAKSMNDLGFSSERNQIEIIVSRPQELTAVIDGTIVKVGSGDYRKKLERLLELEDEIKRRNIPVDFIDLRFENRVVVKPVKEVIR
ncbi:MAG: FtsQ-type POTRA domain-containing protein [Nitrospirae bacterium]|nr:FtsQ-type POTRA domain-containing protein [Nitrospirota bacterium]